MRRIGIGLIQEKKAQIAREKSDSKSGGVERKDMQGRDLLTLLLKANMATDIPDSQRLSDEDVLARESYRAHGKSCAHTVAQRFRRTHVERLWTIHVLTFP